MATVCVTPEMVNSWEKSGKNDFMKMCRSFLAEKHSIENPECRGLKRAIYEICLQEVQGNIRSDQLTQVLLDLTEFNPEVPCLVADVLAVLDTETVNSEDRELRERLMALIPDCYPIVPEPLMKACLDQDTLENIGLLSSKTMFQQKYVKLKTKLFYKQQKFNLLREETEGYSKLVTELNQDFTHGPSHLVILENVKSLIGCFNLDPNRVLDIILESFEQRPEEYATFVLLVRSYLDDQATICHTLGFKFHFYQQTQDSETPQSLYKLAAYLLRFDLISLDTLYPHLSPSDSDIVERHKRELLEARQYARKMNIVSLADKDKSDNNKDDKDAKIDQGSNNQKLGLCEACIRIGDWKHAKMIMDRLPPFMAVSHRPVADTLCSLVTYLIEPIYTRLVGLPESLVKRRRVLPPDPDFEQVSTVSQASDWLALVRHVFPVTCCLGPHLACNTVLMGKLVRLAKCFMEKRGSSAGVSSELSSAEDAEEVFRGLLTLTDEALLPSLSQLSCNCCMAEEVWGFLKLLKYEHRYRLYGQWRNERVSMHPKLIRLKADVTDKAKYIMKRLAKENVKQMGRQIGKLSHSNPGVLFEFILSQIQKYDNFIGPVVDSLKFLTGLSYDVMAYCIIEALASPDKERLKHDDTNISLWLQSLANFSGTVLKKYQIDLGGILQYVTNQLKAGKSYDLLILREIVQKMVGIEVSDEVTNDQLEASTGGELLRQEGGYFSQVRNTKKSSGRLKDSLLEHRMAIPLCLLMAQQRNAIVFTEDAEDRRHIKLIGKLYDQCQDTLVQFVTFLSLQLSTDELEKRLPPIDELMLTYQVSADVAFALWRICYSSHIQAKYDEMRKADRKDKQQESNSQGAKVKRYLSACETVMSPVQDLIYPLNSPKVWAEISLKFYTTFWSLTAYDLQVPTAAYEKQKNQLRLQLIALEDSKELAQSKKKKERERCQNMIDRLQDEEKRQEEHIKMVRNRLKHEKDTWFTSKSVPKQSMITAVLQLCLFPRCCFTSNDAIYCAKFLHILHNLKTPNFSSLICYDRIFTEAVWAISSCTESEAHRFGRFLCAVLDDIMRWHNDKNIFDKECANYPGFVTVFRVPKSEATQPPPDSLDFENYRHVVHKWQYSLCVTTANNIESKDYIPIRNALIVLTKVLPHFPRVLRFGNALERRVERVCQLEKEKRPDLYALAMGYIGQLKLKRKTWIEESEFHIITKKATGSVSNASTPKKVSAQSTKETAQGTKESSADKKAEAVPASKEKKVSRPPSTAQPDARDVRDAKESKSESDKSNGKERKENGDASKEKSRSRDSDDKPSKDSDKEPSSKTRDRDSKSRSQEKEVKDKSEAGVKRAHRERKDDIRSPKEEPTRREKVAKVTEEQRGEERSKREDKDSRRKAMDQDRDAEKPPAEERERSAAGGPSTAKDDSERDRSREKSREEKREARALEKAARDKDRSRRERDYPKDKEREGSKDDKRASSRDRGASSATDSFDNPALPPPASTSNSHSSSHRRSADPSPKRVDDRDIKRRKLEVKESLGHHTTDYWDRPHKLPASQQSPAHDRSTDFDSPREREKHERKRDRSSDDKEHSMSESKRHRVEPSLSAEKQNGEAREKSREKARSADGSERKSRSLDHDGTKQTLDKTEKERKKSDKHSSQKKSKHH